MHTPENQAACADLRALRRAMEREEILEGTALLCDAARNLHVQLGDYKGMIPREETACGIADGSTKEIAILTRVGKPVCCTVLGIEERDGAPLLRLSRRRAQSIAQTHLRATHASGAVLPAPVTHLATVGALVDIGCGVISMISIENLSVSRIPHPSCRLHVGQEIYAAVLGMDTAGNRIYLTHKELLGTWSENAALFSPGMTVAATVRGVKDYGLFMELTPNLSGLAEVREGITDGDRMSVYIKAILPERMKIKLLAIDQLPPAPPQPLHYFLPADGRLTHWRYAPEHCVKQGQETNFSLI